MQKWTSPSKQLAICNIYLSRLKYMYSLETLHKLIGKTGVYAVADQVA